MEKTEANEEEADMNFDYENSFQVIQKSLNCDDPEDVEIILDTLERAKVKGALSGEIKADDSLWAPVVLEIESEDNKIYRIYMNQIYNVEGIQDMDTGKYIYRVIK